MTSAAFLLHHSQTGIWCDAVMISLQWLQKLCVWMFWHMSQTCAAYVKKVCDKCQKGL